MLRMVGWGAAAGAWFGVNFLISMLIVQDLFWNTIPGTIAAWFVYKYFEKKDDEDLKQLCNPPEETWPVRLPIAFGCVVDVLKSSGIAIGASGAHKWKPDKEDQERGIIEARLDFQEMLGGGASARTFARTIILKVELTPEDSNTRVKMQYEVFSPNGAGTVRELIARTQTSLRNNMEQNKETKPE